MEHQVWQYITRRGKIRISSPEVLWTSKFFQTALAYLDIRVPSYRFTIGCGTSKRSVFSKYLNLNSNVNFWVFVLKGSWIIRFFELPSSHVPHSDKKLGDITVPSPLLPPHLVVVALPQMTCGGTRWAYIFENYTRMAGFEIPDFLIDRELYSNVIFWKQISI